MASRDGSSTLRKASMAELCWGRLESCDRVCWAPIALLGVVDAAGMVGVANQSP